MGRSAETPTPGRDRVVVYVTDAGFLVPSLVSAEQVRRQVADIADVVVALTGFPSDEYPGLAGIVSDLGLRPLRMDEIDLPDGAVWHRGHVPRATLGRFLLPKYLDRAYRHVLYLDGDTQIPGDVRPLVSLDVPAGMVGAAPDLSRLDFRRSRFPEGYFDRLGIADPARYFNAGVLAFERATFDDAMARGQAFFAEAPHLCRYHDQSALNAVMQGHVFALSPRYNVLSPYYRAGVGRTHPPVIVHFNGPEKPWQSDGPPWHGAFLEPYRDMVRRYPSLSRHLSEAAEPRPRRTSLPGVASRPLRAAANLYRRRIFAAAMSGGFDFA